MLLNLLSLKQTLALRPHLVRWLGDVDSRSNILIKLSHHVSKEPVAQLLPTLLGQPRTHHKVIDIKRIKLAYRTCGVKVLRSVTLEIAGCLDEVVIIDPVALQQGDIEAHHT